MIRWFLILILVYNISAQESVVVRKSVPRAIGLSLLIPGAGELYAQKGKESWIKGAIFAAVEITAISVYFSRNGSGKDYEKKYQNYADANWSVDKYLAFLESSNSLPSGYLGRESSGIDLSRLHDAEVSWASRSGASEHHVYEQGRQQYYEMIYKYPEQFGQAWSDADPNLIDPLTGLTGYTPSNLSNAMLSYRSLRRKSNLAFETARTMTGLMIANRFISALDAAWTVRRKNKEKTVSIGMKLVPYWVNEHLTVLPGLHATF